MGCWRRRPRNNLTVVTCKRGYLKGVSPETLRYYRWVRRAFQIIRAQPKKDGMLSSIQILLADGVSAGSVNTYLRGFRAYVNWLIRKAA